ncbi:hypothetical protein BC941DRAFT_504900 [Chlamydoabsidia padenii]|nr:hypothetical protein BC941DRAFT_504900 [Chlamydoabsidia padenii]
MKNPFAKKPESEPPLANSNPDTPVLNEPTQEKTQTTTEPVNAYSTDSPPGTSSPAPPVTETPPLKEEQGLAGEPVQPHHKPNKGRLVIRFWQVLAAIGAFGFQIGASPYAGIPFLFQEAKLQYYTYAIDLVSLLWALFMIYVYLTRRFGSNTGKVRRPIAFAVDTALAALFGVATFYQFASYNCPPGYYNGWCNFHNTGKFFLLSLFLSYIIMMFWDLFGGCTCLRKKE